MEANTREWNEEVFGELGVGRLRRDPFDCVLLCRWWLMGEKRLLSEVELRELSDGSKIGL